MIFFFLHNLEKFEKTRYYRILLIFYSQLSRNKGIFLNPFV
ncbi:hypothetical protein RV02_GL002269 [Enterococcus gilvus]|nr:hypothetical protein RV02_GL002269 [Enterococcus gilvus]